MNTAKRLCSAEDTRFLLEIGFIFQAIYIDRTGKERVKLKTDVADCNNI